MGAVAGKGAEHLFDDIRSSRTQLTSTEDTGAVRAALSTLARQPDQAGCTAALEKLVDAGKAWGIRIAKQQAAEVL